MSSSAPRIIQTKRANGGRPLPPCRTCGLEINRARDREVIVKANNPHTQYRHVPCARKIGLI